jgi:hypothetical protein
MNPNQATFTVMAASKGWEIQYQWEDETMPEAIQGAFKLSPRCDAYRLGMALPRYSYRGNL